LTLSAILVVRESKFNFYYLLLVLIGVIGGTIFEYPFIILGFWSHLIEPKVLGVSWYASLMYIPWITFTYITGTKLSKKFRMNEFICYFIIGTLVGLVIDVISINLGFYKHNFNSILRIFQMPIEMTVVEGLAITFLFYSVKKITSRFFPE